MPYSRQVYPEREKNRRRICRPVKENDACFQNAAGLKRKYFIKTEQGSAGIYEWESEQHARAFYNDTWRAQMEELAGDSLTLEYTHINAILDNVSGGVDYRI